MSDITVFTEGTYGMCMRCGRELEESEFAIGDVCEGCRPQFFEDWDSEQERRAEALAEARRYPEESDDDEYCDFCDRPTDICGQQH